MLISEEILNLFGLKIKQKEQDKKLSSALTTDLDSDGGGITLATAGAYGAYLDTDGQLKSEVEAIRKYREISQFAEVDIAIQEIVNEAIPQEQDTKLVKLNLDSLDNNIPESVKKKIYDSFDTILKLLDYDDKGVEYFKRFYIDGKLAFQIIVDKNNLKSGIQKLILLDAQNIKKMKEVTTKTRPDGATVVEKIEEYFLYNDNGFGFAKSPMGTRANPNTNLKISPDAIIYATSGLIDPESGMVLSHLHKAIRPINQLRMLEDATVIYFIARAPERRVFYVDVSNLPKLKAEQYLKEIANRYRNKMVYDARTGDVKNDKKYMSMLEDYWMPRREGGKGTEITTLAGAQNITGYLDSLDWFKEKMYEALNIPKSRLREETGFTLGQSQSITRDEVKFQKFIDRLRNRFGQILIDSLKTQLILTQVCNTADWDNIKQYIKLDFQTDNYFSELKNQEILSNRFNMIQQLDDYLQKYVSKEWVQKNILMLSDDDIKQEQERMAKEKSDISAYPNWKIQSQSSQIDQQQEMADSQNQDGPVAPAAPAANLQNQGV